MEAMLIRILSVRDLHARTSDQGRPKPSDQSQNMLEDDKDSEWCELDKWPFFTAEVDVCILKMFKAQPE